MLPETIDKEESSGAYCFMTETGALLFDSSRSKFSDEFVVECVSELSSIVKRNVYVCV